MNLLKFIQKSLSPKERIAAIVDAVADRLNDRYYFRGSARMVEGGIDFELDLVEKIEPLSDKINLDEVAEAD